MVHSAAERWGCRAFGVSVTRSRSPSPPRGNALPGKAERDHLVSNLGSLLTRASMQRAGFPHCAHLKTWFSVPHSFGRTVGNARSATKNRLSFESVFLL
jgi:hypothetical protein